MEREGKDPVMPVLASRTLTPFGVAVDADLLSSLSHSDIVRLNELFDIHHFLSYARVLQRTVTSVKTFSDLYPTMARGI
jgi:hypothetical protein